MWVIQFIWVLHCTFRHFWIWLLKCSSAAFSLLSRTSTLLKYSMSSTLRSSGIPVHFIWKGEGRGEGKGEERGERGGEERRSVFVQRWWIGKKTRLGPVAVPSLSPLKTGWWTCWHFCGWSDKPSQLSLRTSETSLNSENRKQHSCS